MKQQETLPEPTPGAVMGEDSSDDDSSAGGDDDSSSQLSSTMTDRTFGGMSAMTNGGGAANNTARHVWCTCLMILLLGMATTAAFVWMGASAEHEKQADEFTRSASDSVTKIHTSFEDYVTACSLVHSRCRHRDFTRREFRELYEYLIATGLEFKAVQFDPNVTHEERAGREAEARAYYAEHYPHVDYQGIRGFNTLNSTTLEPRTDQPFYFPIHYQEPILGNEAAIDLDYWSSESRIRAVRALFDTQGPSLTDRLSLVKEKGSVSRCGNHNGPSYGVVLMHPGVNLTNPEDTDQIWPRDFSSIVLCVPDVLRRATKDQSRSSRLYIHDRSHPSGEPVFLGGAQVTVVPGVVLNITFLDEVALQDLTTNGLMLQQNVQAANRIWTVTVLAVEGTYEPNLLFVSLGGAIILVGSLFLTVWVYTNARRTMRYNKVLKKAERSQAIVNTLFPRKVAKQMMEEIEIDHERNKDNDERSVSSFGARGLREYNARKKQSAQDKLNGTSAVFFKPSKGKPIADLFPDTTILFADLEGFTAWSSTREPSQVFTLLETIYSSFDKIAHQRNVFKVETVGDSYVAVAGLPDPRKDHAIVMARFARDCVNKLNMLVQTLEVELGPDTADLGMRFGLHSGGVTAGVLRGERARFQLFGDTVNVAARMESTGRKNMIQGSSSVADLLSAAGKGHWVKPRNNLIDVKGKGEMQTFWIMPKSSPGHGSAASASSETYHTEGDPEMTQLRRVRFMREESSVLGQAKIQRLTDWNTSVLMERLKAIVARRNASGTVADAPARIKTLEQKTLRKTCTVLEEAKDIVELPHFDARAAAKQKNSSTVELSDKVVEELNDFVRAIAEMYRDNPFHNFEHASHVTQSTEKLLSRIVAPDLTDKLDEGADVEKGLHDHTYGITSDPWTQFTVILGAMIHDVDHPGVPNSVLIQEKTAMAAVYKNKSIAESNSIDLIWELLMNERYSNMRRQIYCTASEFLHFRTLLVNTVLATDIMDKEISGLRKARWQKAFSQEQFLAEDEKVARDRKATIVIEHLIQASDVAHTMQHWHIYTKWNRRLFTELYAAYRNGRMETDPSEGWYEGEIGFLNFYVIPLAQKLASCGVFGVSSFEYLTYARENKEEWERKGRELVEEMVEEVKANYRDEDEKLKDFGGSALTADIAIPEQQGEPSTSGGNTTSNGDDRVVEFVEV